MGTGSLGLVGSRGSWQDSVRRADLRPEMFCTLYSAGIPDVDGQVQGYAMYRVLEYSVQAR